MTGLVAVPSLGLAHEGHGAADIIADVTVIGRTEKDLDLRIVLSNRATHEITLMSIYAPGADTLDAIFQRIEPKSQASLELTLSFQNEIHGIFTAVLDFGEDGQGPVLVMP